MADPMRRQEALRIVYGIQTTSVRRRTPPGMLGLRKAVWAWFRQVLTDEERAMVSPNSARHASSRRRRATSERPPLSGARSARGRPEQGARGHTLLRARHSRAHPASTLPQRPLQAPPSPAAPPHGLLIGAAFASEFGSRSRAAVRRAVARDGAEAVAKPLEHARLIDGDCCRQRAGGPSPGGLAVERRRP